MTAQAHAAAVLSMLTGVTVYDGTVPAAPSFPYVVLYISPILAHENDLTMVSSRQEYDVHLTCVGATAASARIMADRVASALLDKTPTVTGRQCWPLRVVFANRAHEDRDVFIPGTATHPVYMVTVYRLISIPS